jgi:hypothetical protein
VKNLSFLLAALLLSAGMFAMPGHGADDKTPELMKKKLGHSQKVLEGIALNKYDMIAANAKELIQISKAVEWRVVKSPQYEIFSNDFRRACEAMILASKEKNIDGAALAYVDLTLTCVRCHKHVREVRQTKLELNQPLVTVSTESNP